MEFCLMKSKDVALGVLIFLLVLSNRVLAQDDQNSASNSPANITPAERQYIESLPYSEHTKKLIYEFANQPAEEALLLQMTSPSIVGPTGSSIGTPTAYAADWGIIAAGANFVNHWPDGNLSDGSASFSVGLGNATKYAGLSVSALIDSLGGRQEGFAKNGTIAAQLFHIFPHNFALAAGVSNLIPWGAMNHSSRNYYAVGTKIFDTKIKSYSMPLTTSVGLGTGAFFSHSDCLSKHDNRVKPFGSVGWRILPRLSIIGEVFANQINAGVSIIPIKTLPFVINISDSNINRYQGTRSFIMVSAAVGYSFK